MWDEDSFVPLQKGDTLFCNDDERVQYDLKNDYGYQDFRGKSFFGYAIAYKEGADRLVQSLFGDPHNHHLLTLPILFLYRHYLELLMKDLVIEGKRVLGQPDASIPIGHKISWLWDELKPILLQIHIRPDLVNKEELEAVEACIKEFAQVDNHSMSFRYPFNKDGTSFLDENSLLASLHYIDLSHLAENMEKIDGFLKTYDMLIITYENRKKHAESAQ